MADKSKIEWTEATWNCLRGCSVVSDGCRHCYAMAIAARFSGAGQPYEGLAYRNGGNPHWTGKVRFIEEHLEDPLRWKRPRRIFVNSMSDLFHESVPDEWIDRVFAVMALSPQHIFQVLTKRPERMRTQVRRIAKNISPLENAARAMGYTFGYDGLSLLPWPIPNIHLGVSCEDQKTADERIPLLLETPAAVRWISAEPLLGPLYLNDPPPSLDRPSYFYRYENFRALHDITHDIHWVVVGGESGPSARPMHPEWARSLRDQCVAAGVPFFFKQWGEWTEELFIDAHDAIPFKRRWAFEGGKTMVRVGKKAAGRLLDGKEWNQYPS